MNTLEVIEDTIKAHPLIDFDNGPGLVTEHWACCPCGFSTKRYKSVKPAHKAFEGHIAEEVNEALIEEGILELNSEAEKTYKKKSLLPTQPAFA